MSLKYPDEDGLILYIMVRNDMKSMNPGKAAAQSSHASNQFVWDLTHPKSPLSPLYGKHPIHVEMLQKLHKNWVADRRGFGTVLTLGGTLQQIGASLSRARNSGNPQILYAWVTDPDYPVVDGNVVHHVSIDTCAYLFGFLDPVQNMVNEMELLP